MKADALPLLRLPDRDWRARGRAHGEALRERINELVERWGDGLERIYGIDRSFYLERFAATTAYETTTRRRAPGISA